MMHSTKTDDRGVRLSDRMYADRSKCLHVVRHHFITAPCCLAAPAKEHSLPCSGPSQLLQPAVPCPASTKHAVTDVIEFDEKAWE